MLKISSTLYNNYLQTHDVFRPVPLTRKCTTDLLDFAVNECVKRSEGCASEIRQGRRVDIWAVRLGVTIRFRRQTYRVSVCLSWKSNEKLTEGVNLGLREKKKTSIGLERVYSGPKRLFAKYSTSQPLYRVECSSSCPITASDWSL